MTRSEKPGKALRRLAGVAYEREMTRELEALARQVDQWREGRISCWDLRDRIHEFHDGASRELFKRYNYSKPEFTVPQALAANILSEDEIPRATLDRLRKAIDYYRGQPSTDA